MYASRYPPRSYACLLHTHRLFCSANLFLCFCWCLCTQSCSHSLVTRAKGSSPSVAQENQTVSILNGVTTPQLRPYRHALWYSLSVSFWLSSSYVLLSTCHLQPEAILRFPPTVFLLLLLCCTLLLKQIWDSRHKQIMVFVDLCVNLFFLSRTSTTIPSNLFQFK
jgi:hypothetical protein